MLPAILSVSLLVQAASAPSVFIARGQSAWWVNETAQGRVIGSSAGPVTVAQLNRFLDATVLYDAYTVCALTAVTNDTYVGLDKETQDDIVQTEKSVRWSVEGTTPDGKHLVARSVLYEACGDPERRGAAILVTEASSSQIVMFEPMGTFGKNDSPIWIAFLWASEPGQLDAPLFSYSNCTECSSTTNVYYDVTRKKLYSEYHGA